MAPTRIKLTQQRLADLVCPAGRAERFYWDPDLPGFGMRALSGGKRVWVVQYRTKVGRTRREGLGDVRVVKLDQARAAARNTLAAVQLGADPQNEARVARSAISARTLFDRYISAAGNRQRPRSLVETTRALLKHGAPLHPLKVCEVSRRDVAELLERVAAASGPICANRVRAHLSAAWGWGLRAGECDGDNPVAFTQKPAREQARERVLADDELAVIWRCAGGGHDYGRIVRLLLLTGARREEVGGMRPVEVKIGNMAGGTWTLPRERSKNGRGHELPLSALAAAQLPEKRSGAFVFGRDDTGFSGWSAAKSRLDIAIGRELVRQFTERAGREPDAGEVEMTPWRLHDLRRTFATWCNNHGIAPHIVEAVLNHVSGARGGVAGVYNHAGYRVQKLEALNTWAAHIEQLVGVAAPSLPKAANDHQAAEAA